MLRNKGKQVDPLYLQIQLSVGSKPVRWAGCERRTPPVRSGGHRSADLQILLYVDDKVQLCFANENSDIYKSSRHLTGFLT